MRGIRRDEGFEAAFAPLFPRARRLATRVTGDPGVGEELAGLRRLLGEDESQEVPVALVH